MGALFLAYVALARSLGVSADAASNALQAWEMLHGNVLLREWTLTDVSFYTNELLLFMAVELVTGLHGDAVYFGVALTYVLVVVVTAAAAKGRARGRAGLWRMLLAVAVVAVPVAGVGVNVRFSSPNHTGTAIPLLLTWLVLDRARPQARWLPWVVSVMLGLGQLSDPLIMYIGSLPLALVCGLRMLRDRRFGGLDLWLVVAAAGSVLISQGLQLAIRAAGGWAAHPPTVEFAEPGRLGENLSWAVQGTAGNFGALLSERHGAWDMTLGVGHLAILLIAILSTLVVLWRGWRRQAGTPGDRVAELAALGIGVNLGAYLVSTLPLDLGTARHIIAVVPLAAVLVGRVWGDRLAEVRPRWTLVCAGLLAVLVVELGAAAITAQRSTHAHDVAAWLKARGIDYGIGSYWYASNLTLLTGGRVRVAPVIAVGSIRGYRSESRADWYDPALHDARFLVLDKGTPAFGTVPMAIEQFGVPVERHEFSGSTVLVYSHNLLVGLPAFCYPDVAPSMAECPPHLLPLFG
ncbi:MAG TPA: hypothetical protein VF062_07870 [Candidatus Limnocylindrales bacterium]